MIQSVIVRQRGALDFAGHYDNVCALQSSCPLPAVKAHLAESVLDINGDRIRVTDWHPILSTIRINKTLDFIAIRSYHQQDIEERDEGNNNGIKKKPSAVRSHEITNRLCKSLRDCLLSSRSLTCLELQGLPLRERDLAALAKGIVKNTTLQHLSMEHSYIGDKGVETVSRGVRNSFSVTSLNFTGCGMTHRGCEALAEIVRHQAVRRHNEAWQGSLRYKKPDLDRMAGMRRITINSNPLVGDQGAQCLAAALKDDLWLKALDLQQCGLSDVGAKILLEILDYNTTLVVLDVRQNPLVEKQTIKSIMQHVMIYASTNSQDIEYKWIKAESPQDPLKVKAKKRKVKILQSNFGKKTTIKVDDKALNRRRSRSTGSVNRPSPGKGIPWRTALRADRCSGYPPDPHYDHVSMYEEELAADGASGPETTITVDYSDDEEHTMDSESIDLNNKKRVKVELERLNRRFKEESAARSEAERRVLELTIENQHLKNDIEDKQQGGLLDDDKVLESIEATFKQFHAFLDLLGDAGLGDLITMAGLDQNMIPFASFRNQLEQSMNQTRTTMLDQSQILKNGDRRPRERLPPKDRHYVSSTAEKVPEIGHEVGNVPPPAEEGRFVMGSAYPPSNASSILGQSAIPDASALTINGNADHDPIPNMLAQNYENVPDPTMGGGAIELDHSDTSQKFDELYQKVLQDAEGALVHSKTNGNMNTVPAAQHRSKTRTHQTTSDKENSRGKRTVNNNDNNLNLSDQSKKSMNSGSDHSNHSYSSGKSAMSTNGQHSPPPRPTPRLPRQDRSASPDKSQNMSGEYSESFEPSAVSFSTNNSLSKHNLDDDEDSDIEELLEVATNGRFDDQLQDFSD